MDENRFQAEIQKTMIQERSGLSVANLELL